MAHAMRVASLYSIHQAVIGYALLHQYERLEMILAIVASVPMNISTSDAVLMNFMLNDRHSGP